MMTPVRSNPPSPSEPDALPLADSANPAEPLTKGERTLLTQYEREVELHDAGYLRVGRALSMILDQRLYREVASSFEKYVQARFRMSRASGYRLIEASRVHEELEGAFNEATEREDAVSELETVREAALRPLTHIPPNERGPVLQKLVERIRGGQRVTANLVEAAIRDGAPKYAKAQRARTFDESRRKLDDIHLEALAQELSDVLVTRCRGMQYRLVARRAAVLAARRVREHPQPVRISSSHQETRRTVAILPMHKSDSADVSMQYAEQGGLQ